MSRGAAVAVLGLSAAAWVLTVRQTDGMNISSAIVALGIVAAVAPSSIPGLTPM
jgi:hypothetical protein